MKLSYLEALSELRLISMTFIEAPQPSVPVSSAVPTFSVIRGPRKCERLTASCLGDDISTYDFQVHH